MPGATHTLMQFTAPEPAGKRIVPNYCAIHENTEVFVHVKMIHRPGLDVIGAGMKMPGLVDEDGVVHDLKWLRIDGREERR